MMGGETTQFIDMARDEMGIVFIVLIINVIGSEIYDSIRIQYLLIHI